MLSTDEVHKIAALEQTHWWYRGTREICFSILVPYVAGRDPIRILDIGCGTGGNLLKLATLGNARGIDVDPLCVDYCRRKGLTCTLGSVAQLDLPSESFELVTIFDVLTSVDADEREKGLAAAARALAPGGLLAIREPAMAVAAGAHDIAVDVRHRFTVSDMRSRLERSGLEPLRITYLNTLLFVPIVLYRRFQRIAMRNHAASDVRPTPEPLNAALLGLLRVEKQLLRHTDMPFGVSVFAVARKPRPRP